MPLNSLDTVDRTITVPSESRLGGVDAHEVIKSENDTLIWSCTPEDGSLPSILKMYRNRGAISWWREHRFQFRVQREYETLTFLKKSGVPCSEPLFWTYGASSQYGRYEILSTLAIPDTTPLSLFLRNPNGLTGDDYILPLLDVVRRMHGAGCYHGALNIKNILIRNETGQAPRFYIIDTPQAILFPRDIFGTRMAHFDLLVLVKGISRHLDPDSLERLLNAYGLTGAAARQFLDRLADHHATRHLRNRLRAEFGLRSRLEHLSYRQAPAGE